MTDSLPPIVNNSAEAEAEDHNYCRCKDQCELKVGHLSSLFTGWGWRSNHWLTIA